MRKKYQSVEPTNKTTKPHNHTCTKVNTEISSAVNNSSTVRSDTLFIYQEPYFQTNEDYDCLGASTSSNNCGGELCRDLTDWAISCNVPQTSFTKLLKILRKPHSFNEFQQLPADCRSLLKTEKNSDIIKTNTGLYYHFGLQEGILFTINSNVTLIDQNMMRS